MNCLGSWQIRDTQLQCDQGRCRMRDGLCAFDLEV
jgi:hypothetical protein